MTTTPAGKTPARKTPTDRQPKKSDQISDIPPIGHDTLKPVAELRSGQIAEATATLMELFEVIGINLDKPDEEVEIETTPAVMRGFGKLGETLEQFTIDTDRYIKEVDTGTGSQQRVAALAMWYLARLGESDGSAS